MTTPVALKNFERETAIWWHNGTHYCEMITYNRALIKKLDGFCKSHPEEYKMINEVYFNGRVEAKEYKFPKKLVTIRKPTKKKENSAKTNSKKGAKTL